MILLINQDRTHTYEYTDQVLYSIPVISPQHKLWGFNLHMEGVEELLGTFDSLQEIMQEIEIINTADMPEYFISGFSDYDGLLEYVDGLTEEEYNYEMDSK